MKHALITLTALACLELTAQAAPVLDLGARVKPLPAANRFAEEGWFVWCGAPVLGGDGKYHLFYSRWPVEVGFSPGWAIHSQIAYAVADHPAGPYRHVNVALPPRGINPATGRKYWDADVTHNPNAFYHNGKYYLYYMGNHGDGKSYPMHRNNQRIGLAVAERPEGPWKRLDAPIVDVSPDRTAFDSLCVTNPAACLRPDGGVLLVYKAVEIIEGKTMGGNVRHGAALADHPEGKYVKQPGRIFEADQSGKHKMVAEDPFIWHSRKYGNRYYAVTRDVVGAFTGSEGGISLFQSEDGIDWKPAANPKVLEARYHLTGGKRSITKLERPALLIENGEPIYLFGAADGYLPQGRISSNVQIPLAPPDARSHETVPAPQGAINGGAELWYDKPAADWNEALPIGNGSLGAMVFGEPSKEQLQFNEESLWTGDETAMGAYQPFGELFIQMDGVGDFSEYRRSLHIADAIHKTTFTANGVKFRREIFASHPDKVIAIRLSADQPQAITATIRQSSAHQGTAVAGNDTLTASGTFENGLAWQSRVRVIPQGGTVEAKDDQLQLTKADSAVILLCAATSFENRPAAAWRGEDPALRIDRIFAAASARMFDELKSRHTADFRALFERVTLDLGPARTDLPTDMRLAAYQKDHEPGLDALLHQYGRYLLISSSRPGSLPANLQGIWNKDPKPAWYCGYTTNINIEMNYWPAEPANLTECHLPLFDWVENLAIVRKKNTQRAIAAKRGWTIYNSNNPMGGNSTWGIHRPGSAWLSRHLWEHYEFTGDRGFLAQRAYPLLKELCEYWEDHLVEGPDGKLISPTGWSPEHGPVKRNGKIVLAEGNRDPQPGASYDQQIVWDLFTNYIEASTELGVDEAYRKRVAAMREKLLGPQIGRWGQLQEWMQDVDDPKNQHRHVSHLFALHPGRQITPLGTPAMARAARVSLDARGDGGTGWSRAWKVNFRARLGEGERAQRLLRSFLEPVGGERKPGVFPNLLCAHPPFQIDGNFGTTSGITEMLLQSHLREADGRYVIHLLPALPPGWPTGSVRGLCARGGFEVDIAWANGALTQAAIRSTKGGKAVVVAGGKRQDLELAAGGSKNVRTISRIPSK